MNLSLEDFYEDIIGKAQRGLGFSDSELISQAEITGEQLQQAQAGDFDETVARKLAAPLNLNATALITVGSKSWHPQIKALPPSLWQVTTDYKGVMSVNAYIASNPESHEAVIFDSGANAQPILDILEQHNLQPAAVLITHSHGDHILEIPTLRQRLGVPAFAVNGGYAGDRKFHWGETLSLAGFQIRCMRTTGHAADGTSFFFELQNQPITVTGDALFAGSMGGANEHWQEALDYTRKHILTLPNQTLICPGHGPATTVAQEKTNNPLFS